MQECHPERSAGSLAGQRSCAALRMTQRDGLLSEMYWGLPRPWSGVGPSLVKSNRAQLAQPALFCYTYTAESTCYSGSLSV